MQSLRFKSRSYLIREDTIDKLDKLSLILGKPVETVEGSTPGTPTSTSDIVNEALDMYFDFVSKGLNESIEEKEEVKEEVNDESSNGRTADFESANGGSTPPSSSK